MLKLMREIGTGVILNWIIGGVGLILATTGVYAWDQIVKISTLESTIEECKKNHEREATRQDDMIKLALAKNDEVIKELSRTRETVAAIEAGVTQLNLTVNKVIENRGR